MKLTDSGFTACCWTDGSSSGAQTEEAQTEGAQTEGAQTAETQVQVV